MSQFALPMRDMTAASADVPDGIGANQSRVGLYETLLGDSWQILPIAVRNAHCRGVSLWAPGIFSIKRGAGVIPRVICWLLRMPESANDLPTRLEIKAQGDKEHWNRSFGRHRLSTVQVPDSSGLLIERFLLLQFWFKLHARSDGLYFEQEKTAFHLGVCVIGIPKFCAPLISASETLGNESGTRVTVRVHLPWIGLLIEYSGDLEEPQRYP